EETKRLFRRTEVGLGHDLEQRRTATVEVDEGGRRANRAPGRAARVHRLRGVLLEMGARDADDFLAAVHRDREAARPAERRFVLADLVGLRQVGIEVVLAREDRAFRDLAVERE